VTTSRPIRHATPFSTIINFSTWVAWQM